MKRGALSLLFFLLAGPLNMACSRFPEVQENKLLADDKLNDSAPRLEPLSKYGNPPFYEVNGQRYYTRRSSGGYKEKGIASWYGSKFHGRRTSSGEIYDMHAMTAAHRSLPLPCYVTVTNLSNKRQIIVRVNDRGPFHSNRIIDLSYAAAVKLGLDRQGTGLVEVRAIEPKPALNRTVDVSENEFYLQVGAFQNPRSAEQLQKRLRSTIDAEVKVSPLPTQQAPFYRVRVGPLLNVETLDNIAKRLTELGFPHPIVVH
ncbi:septal ring lytic transglycosylase RlpA family protein [Nitrosococcus oceani]|uniref:Endolytic peptidoglycan transglycosylase RlpA n=2 Tax=Nitrosococcus oceani TaxID=1229 RepID=Q3J7W0_NITOC|nr:septal ring lytic transglycosylase RlpA family protein [Nitrosococcus oceani]ABA59086.1 Rare lipoprotein A [Nitrosococcus oceani ATCC 19707]EDZ66155.1 Rare lipoprotein A double-psi beta-barrel, putative [Nitrosococcus oceani AFC27]KFI18510.1 lipoprotein [Nitrosococcus oceani C-27]KFI21737.1 lipoprotein [Nitrosococcus oceani]GEM21153.1 septal ring lytic transglycosylase RlpA family lipoprotein [Nitrosococcus oceani]